MKINYIQISNILSFGFHKDVENAQKIEFRKGLNVLIGHNGSGKSTLLEVINFIFKKVLFIDHNINQKLYDANSLDDISKKGIIRRENDKSFKNYRLDSNWKYKEEKREIVIEMEIDDVDINNIKIINAYEEKLKLICAKFSNFSFDSLSDKNDTLKIKITLEKIMKILNMRFFMEMNRLLFILKDTIFINA